jgi:hypothetical protein
MTGGPCRRKIHNKHFFLFHLYPFTHGDEIVIYQLVEANVKFYDLKNSKMSAWVGLELTERS